MYQHYQNLVAHHGCQAGASSSQGLESFFYDQQVRDHETVIQSRGGALSASVVPHRDMFRSLTSMTK